MRTRPVRALAALALAWAIVLSGCATSERPAAGCHGPRRAANPPSATAQPDPAAVNLSGRAP